MAASQTGRSQVVVEQDRQSRTRSRHLSKPHLTHTPHFFSSPYLLPSSPYPAFGEIRETRSFLATLNGPSFASAHRHTAVCTHSAYALNPNSNLVFFTRAFFLLTYFLCVPSSGAVPCLEYVTVCGHLLRYRCSRLRGVTIPLLLLPEREMISANL